MKTKIKKTLRTITTVITALIVMSTTAFAVETKTTELDLSEKAVYDRMIALKEQYPTGMKWTNANKVRGAGGCSAFAYVLSDAAFGDLTYTKHNDFNNIRVGDTIRMNNNTHSVVILSITDKIITVAEGNYDGKIYWGREFTPIEMKNTTTYILTYYPENYVQTTETTPTAQTSADKTTAPITSKPVAPTPAPTTTTQTSAPTTTGVLVITTRVTDKSKSYEMTIEGNGRFSAVAKIRDNYATPKLTSEKYGLLVTSDANSTAFTVTYAGQTITVQAGETKTISK